MGMFGTILHVAIWRLFGTWNQHPVPALLSVDLVRIKPVRIKDGVRRGKALRRWVHPVDVQLSKPLPRLKILRPNQSVERLQSTKRERRINRHAR